VILVDTDILVDFLRGYPPSVAWFDSVGYSRITLCGLSALELLEGCRNRNETDALLRFLAPYRIVWPGPRDFDRVLADFAVARLDRKVGIMDVLIGETAVGLGLPRHTFNVRHFSALPALKTVQPYTKSG
jgi:predicted nucleic acid-binding protein